MLVLKNFFLDDPLWKKILQIRTANFANSEINSQVPPVSLKAELTVFLELPLTALIRNFEFSYGPYLLTIELIEVAQKLSFIEIWLWATSQH